MRKILRCEIFQKFFIVRSLVCEVSTSRDVIKSVSAADEIGIESKNRAKEFETFSKHSLQSFVASSLETIYDPTEDLR